MGDPLTAAASLVSIFSAALQAITTVADRAKESGDTQLLQDVIAAQSKFMELQTAMMECENENQTLRKELQVLQELGDLIYHDGCYWEKKGDDWEGPFCVSCKDGNGKKVRMDFPKDYTDNGATVSQPQCPFCNNWGQIPNPKPPG